MPKDFDAVNLLKKLSEKILNEIPFYGFFTDGGIDQNNTEFWVNRVFLKGNWSICSRSGRNFHIIGTLVKGKDSFLYERVIYKEIFKLIDGILNKKYWFEKYISCFKRKPTEIQLYMRERFFKILLSVNKEKILEYLVENKAKLNSNALFHKYTIFDIMKALENFNRNCQIPLESINFISEYKLKEKNLVFENNKLAIIKGCDISRKGYFTCPVKTLMIFVSEEIIDYDINTEYRIFDECLLFLT